MAPYCFRTPPERTEHAQAQGTPDFTYSQAFVAFTEILTVQGSVDAFSGA